MKRKAVQAERAAREESQTPVRPATADAKG